VKAVLLDGSGAGDETGERVRAALTAQLKANGWDVEHIAVREKTIGNCLGNFNCWIRTPGVCILDDDNRAIAAALVTCDLAVYLTPVTFGGYSSILKRFVDHQIQNVAPYFTKVDGETHHQKRYAKSPDFLVVGWLDAPDPRAEAIFRHLVWRNALNWRNDTYLSDVLHRSISEEDLQNAVSQWLHNIRNGMSSQPPNLPEGLTMANGLGSGALAGDSAVKRALLLVGSPKQRNSTSTALGEYLLGQLEVEAIETETIYLHTALRTDERVAALLDATDRADLAVLSFPLYVDSLPAPAIEALERIAVHRKPRDASHRQVFAAIANSGFPEAYQSATALAICETFARQAGFAWAGGLALGAGTATVGTSVTAAGGRALRVRMALDQAAEALAHGHSIPDSAKTMMAQPLVPGWLYRILGNLGWRPAAKAHGVAKQLRCQPYASMSR
jgi:multimeric flavodoxin WrbA